MVALFSGLMMVIRELYHWLFGIALFGGFFYALFHPSSHLGQILWWSFASDDYPGTIRFGVF